MHARKKMNTISTMLWFEASLQIINVNIKNNFYALFLSWANVEVGFHIQLRYVGEQLK